MSSSSRAGEGVVGQQLRNPSRPAGCVTATVHPYGIARGAFSGGGPAMASQDRGPGPRAAVL
jgi:hypothetical protein